MNYINYTASINGSSSSKPLNAPQQVCKWIIRCFVVFLPFYMLGCSIKSEIKNSIFYTGSIISSTSWSVVSVINFYENTYAISITDNSHGQLDKKVTEKGSFKMIDDTLIMTPNIRLICPELMMEWQKVQVVNIDEAKSDSIAIQSSKHCNDFTEYKYVDRDTLNDEFINKLGFLAKKYIVTKEDEQLILTVESGDVPFRKWVIH